MKRDNLSTAIKVLCIILALSVILIIGIFVINATNSVSSVEGSKDISDRKKIHLIDGVKYREKDTVNILLIGVDKYGGFDQEGLMYYNTQQADFLAVLSVNQKDKEYSIFHINRDMMVVYKQLGVGGYSYGKTYGQIALSHTEGSGGNMSAMNTVDAVESCMYGITIDYYVAVTMDVMEILADDVVDVITGENGNGISITLNEGQNLDGFGFTSSTVEGNVLTLHGSDALKFVRARKDVDDQTNIARMERQRLFIDSFIKLFNGANMSESQMMKCYDLLTKDDHMISNMTSQKIYELYKQFFKVGADGLPIYKGKGIVTPNGESKVVDGHVQFTPDESHLKELIIKIFYDKVAE